MHYGQFQTLASAAVWAAKVISGQIKGDFALAWEINEDIEAGTSPAYEPPRKLRGFAQKVEKNHV